MSTVRVRYRDQHGIVVESVTLPPAEGPNFNVQLNTSEVPMSETARCVNCGETHAVEMVGGLRVIGCPAMLADGSQIFLDEAASRVARNEPWATSGKALVARTENALRDFEGRNDSDTAEALRLLDDDRRAFADGSCRETRVDAVRRMRGGWPAAERISAENAKLREDHAEYVRDAEIGTARRNAIARDAFDEGATARAFVAAVAALSCVHGRKREDGPCPAYEPARDAVGPPMLVPTCPPCAARKLMANEERDG